MPKRKKSVRQEERIHIERKQGEQNKTRYGGKQRESTQKTLHSALTTRTHREMVQISHKQRKYN